MTPKHEPKENVVGWLAGLFAVLVIGAALFPAYGNQKGYAKRTQCFSNLKQVGIGFALYTSDNEGWMPPSAAWIDELKPYTKSEELFDCSVAGRYGYAMNEALTQATVEKWSTERAAETPVAFESVTIGRSVVGSLQLLPRAPRHGSVNNIAYVDGHAKGVRQGSIFNSL
ncbi:hypothetical protein [Fimbriimonas ginsengisoli]|uniref:DUF1559 domain-containing protein n=1 Tax=Fimbriimonas ginsengisoli Gsoil 348 TaxID=661478 RepID=A0A068NRJ1_FIMGI|nr:hypothetical protein [Fimbriimonas ginsengisoli]AIE85385.1 hypothetical protein OP10G_2017 [Fimbriimonas ginsengisoli Gsoil 348]